MKTCMRSQIIIKKHPVKDWRGGCGQILGPCYFKLVPDFACTPNPKTSYQNR